MESLGRNTERDVARVLIMLVSLAALVAGVIMAFTTSWWWAMVGAAVLLFGVSVQPKDVPAGVAGRWDLPQGVVQGVGMAAVPLSVAAAVEWAWWWILVGLVVLVAAAVVSSELDKPKAQHRARR